MDGLHCLHTINIVFSALLLVMICQLKEAQTNRIVRTAAGVMELNDERIKSAPNNEQFKSAPENLLRPWTNNEKNDILDLHNTLRGLTSPPAANMKFMAWDSELERSAKDWADNCVFEHGKPDYVKEPMGQNLYIGPDTKGLRATTLWYEEYPDYNFEKNTCRVANPGEKKVMCGHYTQVVWANSSLLGCAATSCPDGNLIVCHYSYVGNIQGLRPFLPGIPCSQCRTDNGQHCYEKLCVSSRQCKTLGSKCDCNLQCLNCGTINTTSCNCQCKLGWDSPDCSKPCENAHEWCGKNPGFPNFDSCHRDPRITDDLCREMCRQCKFLPPECPLPFFHPDITGESGKKLDVCCGGKMCPSGYVLDEDFCECISYWGKSTSTSNHFRHSVWGTKKSTWISSLDILVLSITIAIIY